jgi:hypothetical protein
MQTPELSAADEDPFAPSPRTVQAASSASEAMASSSALPWPPPPQPGGGGGGGRGGEAGSSPRQQLAMSYEDPAGAAAAAGTLDVFPWARGGGSMFQSATAQALEMGGDPARGRRAGPSAAAAAAADAAAGPDGRVLYAGAYGLRLVDGLGEGCSTDSCATYGNPPLSQGQPPSASASAPAAAASFACRAVELWSVEEPQ